MKMNRLKRWLDVRPALALGLAIAAGLFGLAPAARAEEACRGRDLRPLIAADPALDRSLAEEAAAMPFGRGRFFRVDKPGLAPSFLYGTIHHSDPRVTTFAPSLTAALDGARVVALELAETEALDDPTVLKPVQSHVLAAMIARPAERADNFLSASEMAGLEQAFRERGQPAVSAHTFRPAFMSLMLALPACLRSTLVPGQAVDVLIARRAREHDIPLVGLESLADQFNAIAATPAAMQGPLAQAMVKSLPYEQDVFETTTQLYAEGQIGWLVTWSRQGTIVPGVEAPAPPGFFEMLIDQRNRHMADAALPLLAKGGAFIAVGAAHLPGEQGLARLIQQAGYTVQPVE